MSNQSVSAVRTTRQTFQRPVLQVGTMLDEGRYTVVRILKTNGGMSNVYLVRNTVTGNLFFMKQVVDFESASALLKQKGIGFTAVEEEAIRREQRSLVNEVNVLKHIANHTNLTQVPVVDFHAVDKSLGSRFMISTWFSNTHTLDSVISERRKAEVNLFEESVIEENVQIILSLCSIIGQLHQGKYPVIYRDVKPSNVLVDKSLSGSAARVDSSARMYLVDFGISEVMTQPSQRARELTGTVGFYAPEQMRLEGSQLPVLDVRSDIYSLGCTLYNLLTGYRPNDKFPFKDENGEQVLKPIQHEGEPVDLYKFSVKFPEGLRRVILKCTQPKVSKRYSSVAELMADVQDYRLQDQQVRSQFKRKQMIVRSLFGVSLLLAASSATAALAASYQANMEYTSAVQQAQRSSSPQDYVRAIGMRPSEMKPYFGLVSALRADGVFSSEDEKLLLDAVSPHLGELKSRPDFGDLAYQIGSLYWFYYDSGSGAGAEDSLVRGQALSVSWFDDALQAFSSSDSNSSHVAEARLYSAVGRFHRDIASSIRESSDSGKYKAVWDSLQSSQSLGGNDVVNVQRNLTFAYLIDSYGEALVSDGVSLEEIEAKVKDVQMFVDNFRQSPTASKSVKASVEELRKVSASLPSTVQTMKQVRR